MKQSLLIALFSILVLSCTKQDVEENEISKDLTKASASTEMTDKQSKIMITNCFYNNTRGSTDGGTIYIFVTKNNEMKAYDVALFSGYQRFIELIFDPALKGYTYQGDIVKKIDLNHGGPADDIDFGDNITYTPYVGETQIIIKNHENMRPDRLYSTIDPTGIYGGSPNAIIQTYRDATNPEIIRINIMPWGSPSANLDGKQHFFHSYNPNDRTKDNKELMKLNIINRNYMSNKSNKMTGIKIKVENTIYPPLINLAQGKKFILTKNANDNMYYFDNDQDIIESIDFNNGRSADDLNFNYSMGCIEYIARNANYPVPIVDLRRGFIFSTIDADGINGGSRNAQILGFIDDNGTPTLEICK